ncbi:nickel-dependent hydrogenase large subunit [Methylomagnum sp.]
MPLFTRLVIDCQIRHHRIESVKISARRPPPLGVILRNKTPEQALATLGNLFALCRLGQCLAASHALARALDLPAAPDWLRLLRTLRDLEMLREHSLNLLRLPGWPVADASLPARLLHAWRGVNHALAGEASQRAFIADGSSVELNGAAMASYWRDYQAAMDQLLGKVGRGEIPNLEAMPLTAVLSGTPPDWGRCDVSPLPRRLPDSSLAGRLRSEESARFALEPDWEGRPCETGCFSRQQDHPALASLRESHGNGLITRLWARILEIQALRRGLDRRLRWLAGQPVIAKPRTRRMDGHGLAQVQTSRGLLIHSVEVRDGLVADYRYVAPTEWNFHPAGLSPRALSGCVSADEAETRRRIGLFLHAVDPCVEFEIRLHDI